MTGDEYAKELEMALRAVIEKFRQELQIIRSNRPSLELVEDLKVNYYDQWLTIKQLGSLSIVPPREIHIQVWDKNAVGPVVKAIEAAKVGLTTSSDGNVVRAVLSPLGEERREELTKLVRKNGEGVRIQIRSRRDEAVKKVKTAEDKGELSEDQAFHAKEKMQKFTDDANRQVESLVRAKLVEFTA